MRRRPPSLRGLGADSGQSGVHATSAAGRRVARTHRVIMEDDRVIKVGDPRALAIEAGKLRAAADLGRRCGLFIVPEVLEFDEVAGTLTMARLQAFTPLRELPIPRRAARDPYERAGAALAAIHHHLDLGDGPRLDLPQQLDSASFRCWLHGDYTKTNVGVLAARRDHRIAILDWQLSHRFGGNANYGTACFDVGWFVSSVFMEPPHRHLGSWHLRRRAHRFLRGYFTGEDHGPSLSEFLDHSRMLLHRRRDEIAFHAGTTRRHILRPAFWHWASYLDGLERREIPLDGGNGN